MISLIVIAKQIDCIHFKQNFFITIVITIEVLPYSFREDSSIQD